MDPGRMLPEQASAAHVPGLAVTFAAAFRDDATIRWPMPGATPAVLAELFGVILTPTHGRASYGRSAAMTARRPGCRRRWPGGSPPSSKPPAPPSAR